MHTQASPWRELWLATALMFLTSCDLDEAYNAGKKDVSEAIARGNMRVLGESLAMYRHIHNAYPWKWSQMFPKDNPPFAPRLFQAMEERNQMEYQGYMLTYLPMSGYSFRLTATPLRVGKRAALSFFLDQTGYLRHCLATQNGQVANDRDAPEADPPAECGT